MKTEQNFPIQEKPRIYVFYLLKKNLHIIKSHAHSENICMGELVIIQRTLKEYARGGDQWETTKQNTALAKKWETSWLGNEKQCKWYIYLDYNMKLNTLEKHSQWSNLEYYRLNERRGY